GVSMRLIFVPSCVNEASAMLIVMWRFCSSGSVSRMLVPSSTLPRRVVAPTEWRRDSTRLVLPDPPWPTTATFLIFVGSGDGIKYSPALVHVDSISRDVRALKVESDQAPEGRRGRQARGHFHEDDEGDHDRREGRRRRSRRQFPSAARDRSRA